MRPWEEAIRCVTPYVPGEQPKENDLVKLNTNENPYPPSPTVLACLREMEGGILRKYPDPASAELVKALAERYGLSEDRIFVGVGSDDVLALISRGLPMAKPTRRPARDRDLLKVCTTRRFSYVSRSSAAEGPAKST